MATLKTLMVNLDDYNAVQVIMDEAGKTEPAAVTALMEIGLYNILHYPTGIKQIDDILSSEKWPEVVRQLKAVWKG